MAAQSYTMTSAAPTQPASGSYALLVDYPTIKVAGLKSSAVVFVRLSFDGSNPDATDSVGQAIEDNGLIELSAKTGDKIVFVGKNIESGNDVTIEVRSS